MIIISAHTNTDFDGLASMVAAQKLYPKSVIVFPGIVNNLVREFLSLYKDTFNIVDLTTIDLNKIDKLILVDTKRRERIGRLKELLNCEVPIIVYDHHDNEADDVVAAQNYTEKVGATVTLLVEKIIEQQIDISSVEATIFALGIYEDTGNMLYSTTTARDMRAAAFLLEKGANLDVTADFLGRPLSEQQKQLLQRLLDQGRLFSLYGLKIMITQARTDNFIGGLPLVLNKMTGLEKINIIFAVVQMGEKIHLVARSYEADCNILSIVEYFGGKGHEAAASAVIKDSSLDEVIAQLQKIIPQKLNKPLLARDIMSTPVKTVSHYASIKEINRTMSRYGHSGLPVVDEQNQLVGIISRRDVAKAQAHNLGHAPVKGFMSTKVITVGPEVPINEIEQVMVENDIGRIPVVKDEKLLGIISRSDIIVNIYGGDGKTKIQTIYNNNIAETTSDKNILADSAIGAEYNYIFSTISRAARENSVFVYLVGGIVRDLLLNVDNFDIDIVVEGDAVKLAKQLAAEFSGDLIIHEKFKTTTIIMQSGMRIDLVTARMEYYLFPAALPEVELSSLKQDLYRRDYTINSMALSLNEGSLGQIIDYYGGQLDLQLKQIRVLHNMSFIEDPTRILRAIRFEKRYNFCLETQTEYLLRDAVRNNLLEELSSGRIKHELEHILKEKKAAEIIKRMVELAVWKRIMPEVEFNDQSYQLLNMVVKKRKDMSEYQLSAQHEWLYLLLPLTCCCSTVQLQGILHRYCFTKYEKTALKDSWAVWTHTVRRLSAGNNKPDNSEVYYLLKALPDEALPFIAVVAETMGGKNGVDALFHWYLTYGRNVKISVTGKDIRQRGVVPGPQYRQIMLKLLAAKLNGKALNREEELLVLEEIIENNDILK